MQLDVRRDIWPIFIGIFGWTSGLQGFEPLSNVGPDYILYMWQPAPGALAGPTNASAGTGGCWPPRPAPAAPGRPPRLFQNALFYPCFFRCLFGSMFDRFFMPTWLQLAFQTQCKSLKNRCQEPSSFWINFCYEC